MELCLPLPHGICAGWCWGTATGCSRALWGRASAVPTVCHQLVLPVLPGQGPLVLWWQPGDAGSSAGTAPATHCGSATATPGLVNESVFYFANKYHLFCLAWPVRRAHSSAGCPASPPCISLGVCHVCAASPSLCRGFSPCGAVGERQEGQGRAGMCWQGPCLHARPRTAGPLLGCGKGGPVPTPAPFPAPRGAVMWAVHLGPAAGGFLPCPMDLPFSQGRGASKP